MVRSVYIPFSLINSGSSVASSMSNRIAGICHIVFLSTIALFTVYNYVTLQGIRKNIDFDSLNMYVYDISRMKELRRSTLATSGYDRQNLLTSSNGNDNKDFYSKVKIEAFCQYKERIGEKTDGGKFVCNPKKAKKNCTLLSLGLNNQIGYDKHIFDVTGRQCKIYGADKDPQKQETVDAYTQMNDGQLFVGKIPDQLKILQMMKTSGREEVEMLKIDIEGGEHTGLEPLLANYFVCQIFIEIHGTPAKHLKMLQKMAKYGFRLFNIDPNPVCAECCEYSLINEMCMAQYGVIPLGITIP